MVGLSSLNQRYLLQRGGGVLLATPVSWLLSLEDCHSEPLALWEAGEVRANPGLEIPHTQLQPLLYPLRHPTTHPPLNHFLALLFQKVRISGLPCTCGAPGVRS